MSVAGLPRRQGCRLPRGAWLWCRNGTPSRRGARPLRRGTGRVRELARNLGLAAAALLLAGGVMEGCARLVDLRPAPRGNAIPAWVEDRQLRREAHLIRLLERSGAVARYFELYEWDRYLFYRVRPALRLTLVDFAAPPRIRPRTAWRVVTNGRGFREEPFAPDRKRSSDGERRADAERGSDDGRGPDAPLRVLALGDSSTFGWGVPAQAAYPARAERLLEQRRRSSRAAEVYNLGVPGYSSFQGVSLLRHVALDLDPDALLFSFGSNDGAPTGISDREIYARRASWLGAVQALLHRSRAYETLAAWIGVLKGDTGVDPDRLRRKGRLNVSIEGLRRNLHRAADIARAHELPIAFVGSCLDRERLDVMAAVARRAQVPLVNGYEVMREAIPALAAGRLLPAEVERVRRTYGPDVLARPDSPYWTLLPDRCHPNRIGQHLIAREVASIIDRWLPTDRSPTPE